MKTDFEKMGGTYRQEGDYLLPNIAVPPELERCRIGKYGLLRRDYLKNYKPGIYTGLLMEGELANHLEEIERECSEQVESLISAMKEREGVTEALKASDQMEWVRRMGSIRNRAEEIVMSEVIYV